MKKAARLPLIFILFFLSACGPTPEQQAARTAAVLTETASAWTPTPSATITQTPTSTVTVTPIPSSTPTRLPTKTLTPSATPDPNRYQSSDQAFSLLKLEDWEEDDAGMDYPALAGPLVQDYRLNLLFAKEENSLPVAMYSAFLQDDIAKNAPNVVTISEDFFVSDYQNEYFRWEIVNEYKGSTYHQIFYMFQSIDQDGGILIVTYTRPGNAGAEYDELIDAAMQTMLFNG